MPHRAHGRSSDFEKVGKINSLLAVAPWMNKINGHGDTWNADVRSKLQCSRDQILSVVRHAHEVET